VLAIRKPEEQAVNVDDELKTIVAWAQNIPGVSHKKPEEQAVNVGD
jgi:hypothetical protein